MKFSNDTLSILKNFSEINKGIYFKKGNSLATYHREKFVLAEASIAETLPKDFAIYDLTKFLSVTTLFGEPEFEFKDDRIVVGKDNKSINYIYADPMMVLDPKDKPDKYRQKALEEKIATATLSSEDLRSLKQAAAILQLPDIEIFGEDGKIVLTAKDTSNSASDTFKVEIAADIGESLSKVFNVDHLKLLDGDYDLVIHSLMAYLKHKSVPVEYWIAFRNLA